MAEIVLIHSALGLRPGVLSAAKRLRSAGHIVHTPDLFGDGLTFDEYEPAVAYCRRIGFRELILRAFAAVEKLPPDIAYAGFSIGANSAAALAARRPGATAAFLLHGAPAPDQLGLTTWPATVPVQIHFKVEDPWRDVASRDKLAGFVRAAGAECSVFDYPGGGHLFADPGMGAEFDPQATNLMWDRIVEALNRVDAGRGPATPTQSGGAQQ
jgi:dienelactone hydrolase